MSAGGIANRESTRERAASHAGSERYKVRFPDVESLKASQATELPFLDVNVKNERRRYIGIGLAPTIPTEVTKESLDYELAVFEREYGAEVVVDYQYALEEVAPDEFPLPVVPEQPGSASLDDVLDLINARGAWGTTRGADVTIAVVDTGVNGSRAEFPLEKRGGEWAPRGEDAWIDYRGHGTMCACIATATRGAGGEFDGVAPDAALISCRTRFLDTELGAIYDYLGDLARDHGVPIVATNSFGNPSATPPPSPLDSDFLPALGDAIDSGVIVCFSAGNYHHIAGGKPEMCSPTSVWLHKCRADVLTVGASRPDQTMWHYSSRGPGQHFGDPGMSRKPDVIAPTPPDGRVLYGAGVMSLPEGWGTSGAGPQVAGLAALLLSKRRATRDEVFDAIRGSARPLGVGSDCEGAGVIDCASAVSLF
jgi:serine protease AprX